MQQESASHHINMSINPGRSIIQGAIALLTVPEAGPDLGFLDHFGALTGQLSEAQVFSLNLPKIQQLLQSLPVARDCCPSGGLESILTVSSLQ